MHLSIVHKNIPRSATSTIQDARNWKQNPQEQTCHCLVTATYICTHDPYFVVLLLSVQSFNTQQMLLQPNHNYLVASSYLIPDIMLE